MQSLESQCRELSRFVLSTKTVEELSHVLRAVLTPAEIESIAQRLSILDGISTGVAQREIAETLRVGIATVTRGSRVWQENRECLGKYFPRVKESSAPGAPGAGMGEGSHSADASKGSSREGEGGSAGKGGVGASASTAAGAVVAPGAAASAAASAAVSQSVAGSLQSTGTGLGAKPALGSFIPSPLS